MTVKELIEKLQHYPNDAKVCFYDWRKDDDMFFGYISVAYDDTEIYFNFY